LFLMGFSYLTPGVRAVLTRDVDGIDLGLISIGPAKAGSVINAPPTLLEILIRRGVASLLEEDKIGSEEILKRIWLENRAPSEYSLSAAESFLDRLVWGAIRIATSLSTSVARGS